MCDPNTILELNTRGITMFRDGKRQEAMDNFQASMANLLTYITKQHKKQLTESQGAVIASTGSPSNDKDSSDVDSRSSLESSKRSRDNEKEEETDEVGDLMPPLKKQRQKSAAPAERDTAATTTSSTVPQAPSLPPSSSTDPSSLLQLPRQTQSSTSSQSPAPHALAIPFETPTSDTYPEHVATLFNQVLVFPHEQQDDQSSSSANSTLPREHYDIFYASLLYNMGLVLHNYGLQYSCGQSLRKALETYEVAHGVLLHDLQRQTNTSSSNNSCWDVHHWLLYALFNNMANIYAFANSPIMTQYCLERLRWVLAHSDSNLLQPQDLLFLVVNLDVLGADGPGIIAAASA
ncbi:expressed unknown protein [Seminavis robusta]|uniref:Uncharacterized protein n=1 Tax=Seminavis robusta TaxID=568900 RepID=A0A9N8HQ46_9STRA|nr:expressed unknown protein [Seminavis robusta]|eukprot:Sro952_g224010.1 n/a (348) ;mRNA; f:6157-7200